MTAPVLALRDAVIARLLASPDVAALVQGKVRDDVPSDDEADNLPWICMGPARLTPLDMGCSTAWTVSLKVFAESNAFDRDQAWAIARAAIRVLDKAEISGDPRFCDALKVTGAGDVMDPGQIKTVWFDVSTVMVDRD